AGGIAAHRDAIRPKPESRSLLKHLGDCGVAILKRSRKGVFGGKSVVDREHATLACVRQHPAQPIVRLDASEDAPATVKIDQPRFVRLSTRIGSYRAPYFNDQAVSDVAGRSIVNCATS